MDSSGIGARRVVRGCAFGWLLAAAVLLAPTAACGRAGAPDEAPPAGGIPELPDASPDGGAAEDPDGSAPVEPAGADKVFLNGEELPPELADAFRQAMQTRAPMPAEVAGRLSGRRVPNAGAVPSPADVGPDWTVVEEYLDRQRAWVGSNRERAPRDVSSDERSRNLLASLADRPDVGRAVAAAKAILEQEGAHEKTVEAAEFLVMRVRAGRNVDQHMYAGAKALLVHAPDYENWPRVLSLLDSRWVLGPAIDAFFEELASEAVDPVLRAAGRYYLAAGLVRAANGLPRNGLVRTSGPTLGAEAMAEREAARQGALEATTGLSAGVEEEQFPGMFLDGGSSAPLTLAEAEADLIRSIRHGTVGGTLPELTGKRLDGVEESLSDYRGRIVLLDFWATWCRPCIDVLPDLRKLVAELPADRFALVAISVDEELDTVTRFMEDEPMPWTNWHAGLGSDIARLLRVEAYPTYVLVDEQGRILARPMGRFRDMTPPGAPADSFPGRPPSLPSLIREAVANLSPA